MIKELHKNKKLITIFILVIIFLIFVKNGGMRKAIENFENTDENQKGFFETLLNSFNTVGQTFNNVFTKIDAKNVNMSKSLITTGNITGTDIISTNIKSSNDMIGKNIKANLSVAINNTSISETDLKKMKSIKTLAGYVVDGAGTTHLLFEGGWYNLYGGSKFDAWSNNRWDVAYIFKGWKLEIAQHGGGTGKVIRKENKKEELMKVSGFSNIKPSSYKITWVDY
jgi:hypothetical protein